MTTSLTISPSPQTLTTGIPPASPGPYTQYLRKVGLVVTSGTKGLDLSNLRIIFRVEQFDESIPNTASIRVFNLSDATALRVQKEFQQVTLQAGYEGGNFGVIFQGTIKQFKKGRIDALTSYLDIYASDGDQAYNFAYANGSVAAGSTPQQRADAIQKYLAPYLQDKTIAQIPLSAGTGGVLPRGKVLFGLGLTQMNMLTSSRLCTWKIINGRVVITYSATYDPGVPIELNVRTGLVLVPEATDNGIEAVCLLNPAIRIGQRVHINNRDINTTTLTQAGQGIDAQLLPFPATVTADGFYRVLVINQEGDSRGGNEWFSRLTLLALSGENGQVTNGN